MESWNVEWGKSSRGKCCWNLLKGSSLHPAGSPNPAPAMQSGTKDPDKIAPGADVPMQIKHCHEK
jgi:hypothetical protein